MRRAPVRRPHARLDQSGTGPVVQLAVGDPGRGTGGGTPVSDVVPGLLHAVGDGLDRPRLPCRRPAVKRVRTALAGAEPRSTPRRTVAADAHADPPSLTCLSTVGSHPGCVNDRRARHAG
ncbi:hypothetical protein SFR_6354 [Streptomyces sp. FR-008]|nr:hypothetical protein SFR_6354 [Streptomyces sp. FR-008]